MLRITLTDGPWAGKKFSVPEDAEALDSHPDLPRGQYVIKGGKAKWVPNKTKAKTTRRRSAPVTTVLPTGPVPDTSTTPEPEPPAAA